MDNKKLPNMIYMVVRGNATNEWADMSTKTVDAYLNKETPEAFTEIKEKLTIDLIEAGGEGFDTIPNNLPDQITGYTCTWLNVGSEGASIDLVQLTITSIDRGISYWNMVSEDAENPILFFGDKKY